MARSDHGLLGLDTEMIAHFPEGDFHLSALDEPADDLQRIASRVGAEQGLRVETVLRIARQHPSMPAASIRSRGDRRPKPAKGDRQERQASVAPRPIGQLLVPPAMLAAGALRSCQRGEERQRPSGAALPTALPTESGPEASD